MFGFRGNWLLVFNHSAKHRIYSYEQNSPSQKFRTLLSDLWCFDDIKTQMSSAPDDIDAQFIQVDQRLHSLDDANAKIADKSYDGPSSYSHFAYFEDKDACISFAVKFENVEFALATCAAIPTRRLRDIFNLLLVDSGAARRACVVVCHFLWFWGFVCITLSFDHHQSSICYVGSRSWKSLKTSLIWVPTCIYTASFWY